MTFLLSIVHRVSKEHCLLEGSQLSPVCPSGRSSIRMKMSAGFGGMILQGEGETSAGRKPAPVPLYTPYSTSL
jgi:hypothetical protein